MRTAVDSNILFDIVKSALGAPRAQTALETQLSEGSLCICSVVVAELGRYFDSSGDLQDFLSDCQIIYDPMSFATSVEAARIMRIYASNKRTRDRVAPDFLIGAHALIQADALLTNDEGFFRNYFSGLLVIGA